MRRSIIGACFACLVVAALSGCTTSTSVTASTGAAATSTAWSPAQNEDFILAVCTEAENDATAAQEVAGVSALLFNQIQIGKVTTSNACQAAVQVLQGGNATTVAMDAAKSAVLNSITAGLGLLTAQKGTSATLLQILGAGSFDALRQAGTLVSLWSQLSGGYQPTPVDIASGIAALNSAAVAPAVTPTADLMPIPGAGII